MSILALPDLASVVLSASPIEPLSGVLAKYIVFSVVGRFGDDIRVFMDTDTIFATVVIEHCKRNLPTSL